jgi:tetratricopeptide (TPR) repeat protein
VEKKQVEKFYSKGMAALSDGNWLMAVQYFNKCKELDKTFITAYHELADIFYSNGQFDAAIRELQEALTLEPDDPEAAFALGNIYLAQTRHLEALRIFKRLEQDFPDFAPEVYYNMGVCYKHLGYPEMALECLEEALDRDPSYFECLDIIGRLHLDAGRLDEARKALQEVLDADPGNINARHTLGVVYSKQNLWKEAIEQWETVLSQAPNTDEALRELGWALNMAGEYEKAVTALKKAIEMNPHNLQARIDLGAVFMSNLRFEEAISEWEQARREDPANPLIKKFLTDAQALKGTKESQGKE